jgi:hypothetical protein
MYRLRRLYLDAIGVADNRFSDVTVDLTDLDGEATDSIVWLRNGAGKTTMLSLLLALVLPGRRDFLATRTKNRTLEDLVLARDTSHVVAEWVDPAGQVLLTGAVYEWQGRVRPRDYNAAGKDRLSRMWWCVSPDPKVEGSTFDELPFTTRSGGHVDLDTFRSHIRSLATKGVNATVVDKTIAEWHEALRERRFDPELFRYFAEVNATEGGIDALFSKIDSPGAFVRYLLRFVADERRIEPVRELLIGTATEISKRPVYLAESEFCAEAQPKVEALGAAYEAVRTATAARDQTRASAAIHKGALLAAADTADTAHQAAAERFDALDTQARDLRRAADTAGRERDEYLRLGAVFRLQGAETASAAQASASEAAEIEASAWDAVGDLVVLEGAQAQLRSREQAMAAAAAEAAPILEQLAGAKGALAGALDAAIADAEIELAQLRDAEKQSRDDRKEAETDRDAARKTLVELLAEERELTRTIDTFERARLALVDGGLVGTTEALEAAAERLDTEAQAATAQAAALEDERTQLVTNRSEAAAQLRLATEEARAAARESDRLAGECTRLETRAASVADNPRLRLLLQSDTPDLLASGPDAVVRIRQAVAAADAELLTLRAEAAADEHAVHALDSDGLLPARRSVDVVVQALSEAGITAHTGWRYLAENERPDDHARIIAALPEVCDGVVVYGDPLRAAAAINGLVVDDVVVIAPATVFAAPGDPCTVVGPAPAHHDRSAGTEELVRRRHELELRVEHVDALVAQRGADSQLAERIDALIADLPEDGITGLRRRARGALEEAAAHAETEALAGHALEALDERRTEIETELHAARLRAERAASAAARTGELAATERDSVMPARARITGLPALRQRAEEAEADARRRRDQADAAIDTAKDRIRGLEETRRAWAKERAPLPEAVVETDLTMEAARAIVEETEVQLREQYPEGELRRQTDEAHSAVRTASEKWERHLLNVRARGQVLAATPAGRDADLRVEEVARARQAQALATRDLDRAQRELEEATRELADTTPADRPRHADAPMEPEDRDHALRLAAAAEQERAARQLDAGQTERRRDAVADEVRGHKTRAGMLRDQADKLRSVEPTPPAPGVAPVVISDDEDEVRREVGVIAAEVDTNDAAYETVVRSMGTKAERLRTWASDDRFAKVAEDENGQAVRQLREMFRAENLAERVAPRAVHLAEALADRHQAIAQQLEQVEAHKNNVVSRLSDLADEALSVIARASALSELPAGIGPWEGLRFLDLAARQRPTRDQIALRVGELVDRMVSAGKVEPDPPELLWKAVEASVPEGFRATILKPAPDQPKSRTPVEDMRKWSGGENLTASLVLFFVLARLRSEQRTGSKAAAQGGVVPLDNPLGKANYLPFLELQRKMARANGVQLVFWTGIGDLGAVTAFPRVAAMHKRPSTKQAGAAYVRYDPDSSFTGSSGTDTVPTTVVEIASAVRRDD